LWAVILLAPTLSLALLFGTGLPARAATGSVEVAFTSTASPPNSTQLFQSMLLNVVGVRLNPTAGTVSESDKKWQLIPAPGGASGPHKSGQAQAELQVDLASTQNLAQVLNLAKIPAKTYNHIELVLDPQNPGNFVPLCGTTQPRGEGCIVYPAKLLNPNVPIQVQGSVSFAVTKNTTTPLVLNIDPGITGTPASSADSVVIDPVITVVPNESFPSESSGSVTGNPQLALITGTVKKLKNETISAQLPGTAQVVASTTTQAGGVYALNLPAAATGTTYDLVASARGRSFVVKSGLTVSPGQSEIDFSPIARVPIPLTGKVLDGCTGEGVQGASVELLLPDPKISPTPDCTANTPVGCVIVATAQTNISGTYPITTPGVIGPFQQIPNGTNYTIRVSSSGYNLGNIAVTAVVGALKCKSSGFKNDACSINLERGEIDATVSLGATNTGPAVNALIMAEESGTNNLLSVATAAIPTGAPHSAPVTMFIPDNSASTNPIASLDFFASVQDSFGTPTRGSPQKATGHSIPLAAAVAGSSKCPVQNNLTPASITIGNAACVGHGSVEGTVGSPDNNTVVVLASNGVQLMQTGVPTGTTTPGEFSFCAPADQSAGYTLEHFERQPDGSLLPVASVPITMAAPTTIAAPCSGICSNTSSTCLLCTGVSNVSLP
jgi:hypothetical protein